MPGQSTAGLVVETCCVDSPLTQTAPASATLEAPWIAPRQGSLGAWVAMVAAEFGSNKHEGSRLWTGEGDFGVAREDREKCRGVVSAMATLKINTVVLKEPNYQQQWRQMK